MCEKKKDNDENNNSTGYTMQLGEEEETGQKKKKKKREDDDGKREKAASCMHACMQEAAAPADMNITKPKIENIVFHLYFGQEKGKVIMLGRLHVTHSSRT